jgi:uncharacterized repeat protein (TIGR04076 family)
MGFESLKQIPCPRVSGHDYPWIKQPGTEIVCCADGLHPVLYKLERIDN